MPCSIIGRRAVWGILAAIIYSFLLHVISMWSEPGRSVGIQGQSSYVTSNWVHMKMIHPLFLTAVKRHGLQTGPVLVYSQLSHQCGNIFQIPVSWEMPVQRLRFIFSGEAGVSDMQHTGGLEVLQGP